MAGLIVILIVSWILLHFLLGKNLSVLGLVPVAKSLYQFLIGFVFMTCLGLFAVFLDGIVESIQWLSNPKVNYRFVSLSFLYHVKSAMTEDLLFRGALLYIVASKVNAKFAIILSAVVFGIYHWFSYGLFQSGSGIAAYVYVFLVTGLMGYVWSYAFIKSGSIMLSLGIHVAWNFVITLFYQSSPFGELVFQVLSKSELGEVSNFMYLLIKGLCVPLITLIFINFYIKYRGFWSSKNLSKNKFYINN